MLGNNIAFTSESFNLFIQSQLFIFRCQKCNANLFNNYQLSSLLFSNDNQIFLLLVNGSDYLENFNILRQLVENKDGELNEEDCAFHPVACKMCQNTEPVAKLILSTPPHKKDFRNKILIELGKLVVEQILTFENEFCCSKIVNFMEIVRNFIKEREIRNKESEDNLVRVKELIKNLYSYIGSQTDLCDFKFAIANLTEDYQKLKKLVDFIQEEGDKLSKI